MDEVDEVTLKSISAFGLAFLFAVIVSTIINHYLFNTQNPFIDLKTEMTFALIVAIITFIINKE